MIALSVPAVDVCSIPGLGAAGCAAARALADGPIASVAGAAAGSVGAAVLGQIAHAVFDAWWLLQAKVLTLWIHTPTPTAADLVAPGRAGGYVAWLTQYVLVVSALLAAGRTMLSRDARTLADFARTLALTIVVSALGVTVASALVRSGDAIAEALVRTDLVDAFGGPSTPIHAAVVAAGGTAGPLLIGLLGSLASLVQFFVLLARNAVLPVVVLLLPLAAAAGGSALGRAWFSRLGAWLLALAFYKPVAAVIYAVVLHQARSADTFTTALTALVGMVAAVLALPALIKLFTPAAAGGGGGGSGYSAGMAAGAAARAVASRAGGAARVAHPAAAAVTVAAAVPAVLRRSTR